MTPGASVSQELAQRQVALLMRPSADFTVAMFGAWAAGLGVLPLPIGFPDRRLRAMVADCRPSLLLATEELLDRAERLVHGLPCPPRILAMEDLSRREAASQVDPPGAPSAAFTVYTSGSTGTPKGVLIRQEQLLPLMAWSERTWRLGPWVRMAQTLSLGFDFGLQELFTSVPFGGSLIVPSEADRKHARSYARFLRRERITVLFTTPSFADELGAAGEELPDLRLVLLGGEVLTSATVAAIRPLLQPECRLFNGYGPTEATVNCLMYEVPVRPGSARSLVLPVGRASGASRIEIMDAHGQRVPVGALGEVVIGGPGVAGGYLHQPESTARRFLPDPAQSGGLRYRTGDRAYVDHHGDVVVVGRDDRQAKIRGFRVELGEVEHVLRTAPDVVNAAVRVVDEPRRLVAFVACGDLDLQQVRDHLADRLPAAMIPDQWVLLETLPATHNGKLDDHELGRLARTTYSRLAAEVTTSAEIERVVCELWADLLGVRRVSPNANVFELGAHSLIVTRAHARLQSVLGVTFPAHEIFECPSPRQLAQRLAPQRQTARSGT